MWKHTHITAEAHTLKKQTEKYNHTQKHTINTIMQLYYTVHACTHTHTHYIYCTHKLHMHRLTHRSIHKGSCMNTHTYTLMHTHGAS